MGIRKREFYGAGGSRRSFRGDCHPSHQKWQGHTLQSIPSFRRYGTEGSDVQTDSWLQPFAALPGVAVARTWTDDANTRHGEVFQRQDRIEEIGKRLYLGCTQQRVKKHDAWGIRRRPGHDGECDCVDEWKNVLTGC